MDRKVIQTKEYDNCKYRNKRVIKTVNNLNELIQNYKKTNEKLNSYIIKKDKAKSASLLKSLTLYIFTKITGAISVFFIIFFVGFLIGYYMFPKSVLLNVTNENFKLMGSEYAVLYKTKNKYYLRLDCVVDFTFYYNNLFMSTLNSSMLLYYYPAPDIGMSPNEVCYSMDNASVKEANKIEGSNMDIGIDRRGKSFNVEELKSLFKKFEKDESLIFLNSSLIKDKDENESITYMNGSLFSDLHAYPIGGSNYSISAGIMQGLNSINAQITINTVFDKTNEEMIPYLLHDCNKGRIYVQLQFVVNYVKTILVRIRPQKNVFLPFKVNCRVLHNGDHFKHSKFRSKVIQSYRIQKAAIHSMNFLIN